MERIRIMRLELNGYNQPEKWSLKTWYTLMNFNNKT